MSKAARPELPDNCGQVRIFIDDGGDITGDLAWNISPDMPKEFALAIQDYVHGMMSMMLSDPEYLTALGKAYAAGLDTRSIEEEDEEIEFTFDDPKVTPINTSKRKH